MSQEEKSRRFSIAAILTLTGTVIGIVTAPLTVPEFRRFLRLESSSDTVVPAAGNSVAPAAVDKLTGEYQGEVGLLEPPARDTVFLSLIVNSSGDLTGTLQGAETRAITGKISGKYIRFIPTSSQKINHPNLPKVLENVELNMLFYGEITEKSIAGKWKFVYSGIERASLSPQDQIEYDKLMVWISEYESKSFWRFYR